MDDVIQRAIESCEARVHMYQSRFKNCTEISTIKLKKQILLEETKIKALQIQQENEQPKASQPVKCCECVYYHPEQPYENDCIKLKMVSPKPTDYCSYAKRKESE